MASEMTAASAADSDGSVSWEDFFGTSTDLVPQLLGMFDELARKDGVNNRSGDQIPTALQKRLSLVAAHSQRNTIFGQICSAAYTDKPTVPAMKENKSSDKITRVEITVCHDNTIDDKIKNSEINENEEKKKSSCSRLMPENSLRGRNKKHLDRPLSGSSIVSSTSSSGGSNQDNVASANPYLASVESLADACASSQGSGDSGVGTGSFKEANCMTKRDNMNQRKKILSENAISRNTVERVLLEIVDTEAIYVEHLRQVINGYLIFWRDDPNSLLTKYELSNLFNNIEDIFNFNRKFLNEIRDCQLEPIHVANKFIEHNLGFKIYTEYCTNYPSAVSTLTELMRRDDSAKGFRERQEALGHALPLGSFLLKPVQRILKYHLLLENLSKEFGADETKKNYNDGKNVIDEALKTMTGIAEHINAMKRKHEHAVRVQEIQSLLYGWTGDDLTTNGELIAEGRFRIRGAKAPRHAFLFERMLLLTKKKEDGLLVYKAHIMCSNLMLIESIPGEPFSFHVIPFDNPRLQYTLQARNLEQKREWTLQIKRVMLENYHAVIPIHARQLVLELGQSHHDDEQSSDKISMKKLYTSPPEYLERRKLEKDRRRSGAGLRHKLKKPSMKCDLNENSLFSITSISSSSSTTSSLSSSSTQRELNLNRSLDNRACKVKDRLTNWRRKSEPGFQSYVSFTQSDDDGNDKDDKINEQKMDKPIDNSDSPIDPIIDACRQDTCMNNSTSKHVNIQPQTVEQIVGHILMQNEEFQKLLEKQRNNNTTNVRQQQRSSKDSKKTQIDTSDDSDGVDHSSIKPLGNRITRLNRITGINRSQLREYRSVGPNNWNHRISRLQPASNDLVLPHLRLEYNNFKSDDQSISKSHDKIFKRPSIITDSKIIKTALRMASDESQDDDNKKGIDCPTRPSVWLTKLCEDLPTWQQKSGSLPRSFQINSETTGDFTEENQVISKSRFLQRDGKPLSGRPFTIASDKPAEINLDDLERYKYKSDEQIDKLSTSELNSASTFFCSTGDNSPVDSDNDKIHPDHKIYRSHVGSTMLKNVLSKAGSRLEGLRLTWSTETLESSDSLISDKIKCQYNYNHKGKKRNKIKLSRLLRESSTHVDEPVHGCIPSTWSRDDNSSKILYYKQGSSRLGARIAQADYADPSILFGNYFNTKRTDNSMNSDKLDNERESDCFYEKSFETIEDCDTCVHTDEGYADDAFRDSAIFSDNEEGISDQLTDQVNDGNSVKSKIPPPVPIKKQSPYAKITKLSLATKPANLKSREATYENQDDSLKFLNFSVINNERDHIVNNDVSAGQSQAGWVKRMVGQLQAQIETT